MHVRDIELGWLVAGLGRAAGRGFQSSDIPNPRPSARERGLPEAMPGGARPMRPELVFASPAPTTQADSGGAALLGGAATPIDMNSAFRLAGVENPQIQIASQRVAEAVAVRQLAAAQILPNINAGTSYDNHTGNLQQVDGSILKVNRSSLYAGAGAFAVGSGTVQYPGLVWNGNISVSIYSYLQSRQVVAQRQFNTLATRNDILLQVAVAYLELLRAEATRAIILTIRDDAAEVARLTANYAATGQGRQADAERAATELRQRQTELLAVESDVLIGSARLAQLLNLDPSVRLHAADGWAVPRAIVPVTISLPELIALGLLQRPELAERRAAIQRALLELNGAKMLPFSPNVILAFVMQARSAAAAIW